MGTLFSAFDIARSGLQTAQVQLDVAAHNIANVNTEGFSRQRALLGTRPPTERSYGLVGRGVQVEDIERIRDAFLDVVYRQEAPGLGRAEIRSAYFSRVEDLFQEPGENGFGTRLNLFFDALNDFVNNVEEQPVRMSVIAEAESLAQTLNQVAQNIYVLRTNANEEVRNFVPEINSLSSRIADLNMSITDAELSGAQANDLRDRRDVLLDELAEIVNITYRERTNGQVDVFVSGDSLINGGTYRELVAVRDPALDPDRVDLVEVRFVDSDQAFEVRDGALHGALTARDVDLPGIADRMDQIAAAVIEEINRIQSSGNGVENLSGILTSSNAVDDPTATLDAAGLPFDVVPGTFDVVVYDAAGVPTTTTITINATTTLQSLAADLNGIADFNATVTVDNRLEFGTTAPATFTFANDTSNALAALGVNGLFTGHNASTIGVNQDIIDNPLWLSSAYSLDVLDTGDNLAALDMANVRNAAILDGGTSTVNEFYETTVVRVGVEARANADTLDVQRAFINDFQGRREEVSGVSIDEEVTNLLQFQRAYEASARVINVVDRMLDALFTIAR